MFDFPEKSILVSYFGPLKTSMIMSSLELSTVVKNINEYKDLDLILNTPFTDQLQFEVIEEIVRNNVTELLNTVSLADFESKTFNPNTTFRFKYGSDLNLYKTGNKESFNKLLTEIRRFLAQKFSEKSSFNILQEARSKKHISCKSLLSKQITHLHDLETGLCYIDTEEGCLLSLLIRFDKDILIVCESDLWIHYSLENVFCLRWLNLNPIAMDLYPDKDLYKLIDCLMFSIAFENYKTKLLNR